MADRVRRPALLLLGGVSAAVRYPRYLTAPAGRGLAVLAVNEPSPVAAELAGRRGEPIDHPVSLIDELLLAPADDQDRIVRQVLDWTAAYELRGIVCIADGLTDVYGLLTDLLGLPGPGLRATRVCSTKTLQRAYLERWSPASALVLPADRDAFDPGPITFPAVVKPARRRGSAGVRTLASAAALGAAWPEYDDDELLLVERRVEGEEYSVEALVQAGRVAFESATHKRTNAATSDYFVEMGHTVPAGDLSAERTRRLLAANRAVLARLDFRDGVSHAEYKLTAGGDWYLMEIAARSPGDAIPSLYTLATGTPFEEAVVRVALGERVSYPAPTRRARQVFVAPAVPGRLVDVALSGAGGPEAVRWAHERHLWPALEPVPAGAPPRLHLVMALARPGDLVGEPRDSAARALTFVIDAPSAAQLDELERTVSGRLSILTESADEACHAGS